MTYEIAITDQAADDLDKIYEYIAFEKLSPDNATGLINRLEGKIMDLMKFPKKYRTYEKEPWHSRGLRVMSVEQYVVLYILNENERVVTVFRVMYAGMNIDNRLNNHTEV